MSFCCKATRGLMAKYAALWLNCALTCQGWKRRESDTPHLYHWTRERATCRGCWKNASHGCALHPISTCILGTKISVTSKLFLETDPMVTCRFVMPKSHSRTSLVNGDQAPQVLTHSSALFQATFLKLICVFQCCDGLTKPNQTTSAAALHVFTWGSGSSTGWYSSVGLDCRSTNVCGNTAWHRSSSLQLRCAFPLHRADGGQRIWGVGMDESIIWLLRLLGLSSGCQTQCYGTGESSQRWQFWCGCSCVGLERREQC